MLAREVLLAALGLLDADQAAAAPSASPSPPAQPAEASSASAGGEASLRRVRSGYQRILEGHGLDLGTPGWVAPSESWPPRFEDQVEVEAPSPQEAFERHLEDFEPVFGPTFASGPTVSELREAADHQVAPALNFLPTIRKLLKLLRGKQAPRYFLYLVRRGTQLHTLLREGALAPESFVAPGLVYELVAEHAELGDAQRAERILSEALRTGRLPASLSGLQLERR